MTAETLTDKQIDAATEALNKHPRVAKLDADMNKARADYMRTRDDVAYDEARAAAFAAYDAAHDDAMAAAFAAAAAPTN